MCGIFSSISKTEAPSPNPELLEHLANRGPDLSNTLRAVAQTTTDGDTVSLLFTSTVLSLRGGQITAQPLSTPETGSVLCWNGEAWKIGQDVVEGNDGESIISLLDASISSRSADESINGVLDVLRTISGPFAFVYYDKIHHLVYFGRDCLGRRSLLYNSEDISDCIQFSSIADSTGSSWKEVEADGIYVAALDRASAPPSLASLEESSMGNKHFPCYRYPWVPSDNQGATPSLSLGVLNQAVPTIPWSLNLSSDSVRQLEKHMIESLRLRLLNIPDPPRSERPAKVKLAILFSGGLDCAVLARMAHDILPQDEQIDLLNVAFENPRVVLASKQPPKTKLQRKGRQGRGQPGIHDEPVTKEEPLDDVPVVGPPEEAVSPFEACPDRMTGRSAVKELRQVCPGRKWNFVEANISYKEFLAHRSKVISLIYPHNTEMDLSIAGALYFASRGAGKASIDDSLPGTDYITDARVLLSGLGADELFGGYTRHATAFSRRGLEGLVEELDLDVGRLGKRNLGRDDRAISNWGREARFPYLDEDLVRWSLACPVWDKCGFGGLDEELGADEPALEPGKKVLRLLAWKLGMHSVSQEKKRAIQFGARTAKMETGRTKGTTLLT
ncbi:hypothetical protein V492_03653 [Pseudogymnoascus sp. VKM F-4246]|nr:hypothetical protein V492_03653 [Pseudogymnoascus sp. VKM F-4246]